MATTNAICLAAPAGLSVKWFAPNERVISTLLAIFANYIGFAIGNLIPPFTGIPLGLLIEAIFASISMLFFLIFARRNPPLPTSAAAEDGMETGPSLKLMVKDPLLITMVVLTGAGIAILSLVVFLLDEIL